MSDETQYIALYKTDPEPIPGGGALQHREVTVKLTAGSWTQAVERALTLEEKHGPLVLVADEDTYEDEA